MRRSDLPKPLRSRPGAVVTLCLLLLLGGCSDDVVTDAGPAPGPEGEPTIEALGLRLAPVPLDLAGLSQAEIDRVSRGSYLVNGASICGFCHTTAAGYLAGGLEFPLPPELADPRDFTSVFTRNLTPDAETGLALTESEFIEVMRRGKDFTDSTTEAEQALVVMPIHVFRFMSTEDLQAIYAYLRRIPAVRQASRKTWGPAFPFPPTAPPPLVEDPVGDPDNAQRGLLIPGLFSAGPAAADFADRFSDAVAGLGPEQRSRVGRGSYLVNAVGDCGGCHTGDILPEMGGIIPGTLNVNTAEYLAGGQNIGQNIGLGMDIFARNLTPHPDNGLQLTEEQFVQTLRFGADFRRPGASLRVAPHFPTDFHHRLDDLQAIYAYLRTIPANDRAAVITP